MGRPVSKSHSSSSPWPDGVWLRRAVHTGRGSSSLAESAWWRRGEMRTGTRDETVVQPVSLPSSRTKTWGKLPGSPARLCARFLARVSWCPGCVRGPASGLLFQFCVCFLSRLVLLALLCCLVSSSGSVSKRGNDLGHRPKERVFLTDRPREERALRGGRE